MKRWEGGKVGKWRVGKWRVGRWKVGRGKVGRGEGDRASADATGQRNSASFRGLDFRKSLTCTLADEGTPAHREGLHSFLFLVFP